MASRIMGFGLGLLFISLGVYLLLGVIAPDFEYSLIGVSIANIIMTTFDSLIGNYVYLIPIGFILFGVFALQSAIRDTWPFYG